MNDNYTVDVTFIWFVDGKKKTLIKKHITVFEIFDLLSDKEITSIYLEKNCIKEKDE